jgi:CheY-like chemotaxis protein
MNTLRDSLRKEFSLEYLSYFGVQRIGFNDVNELKQISQNEKIDAAVVFVEETNPENINRLKELDIPIITVSSFALKEKIDKLNPEITIFDPNVPSKTYNAITSSKEQKKVIHKQTVQVQEKPVYKLKALIAEDNPINQKLLKTKLKSMGIEADTANNGLEAFNKYSMNPDKYDVIFMDVQMPIMDGVEATQEILEFEKEEEIPHTPIIAVTANVLKGDRERFIGAGMDDYIAKPIEQKELQRVVDNIIKHKYDQFTQETSQTEEVKTIEPIESVKETVETITAPENEKVIIAAESSFLVNYLKNVIKEEFEVARTLKDLDKKLDKNAKNVLIIEDEFNEADMQTLINSIKNDYPNIKIIVIGEREYQNIDGIISDLNPQTINDVINSIKGDK